MSFVKKIFFAVIVLSQVSITLADDSPLFQKRPFQDHSKIELSIPPAHLVKRNTVEKEFYSLPGIDIHGNDIFGDVKKTKEQCEKAAKELSESVGYTLMKNGDCYPKNGFQNTKFDGNADSVVLLDPEARQSYLQEENKDYNGGYMIGDSYSGNVEQCKVLCQVVPSCEGFIKARNENKCWLKTAEQFASSQVKTNVGDRDSYKKIPTRNFRLYVVFDFPGNDIREVHEVNTPAKCKRECTETKDCRGFSYNSAQKKCFLKKELKGGVAQQDSDLAFYWAIN